MLEMTNDSLTLLQMFISKNNAGATYSVSNDNIITIANKSTKQF